MTANHNAAIAHRIAESYPERPLGKTWLHNALWVDAARDNWNRLNAGQEPHAIALPQSTDGQAIKDLINAGMVGVYQQ